MFAAGWAGGRVQLPQIQALLSLSECCMWAGKWGAMGGIRGPAISVHWEVGFKI